MFQVTFSPSYLHITYSILAPIEPVAVVKVEKKQDIFASIFGSSAAKPVAEIKGMSASILVSIHSSLWFIGHVIFGLN